MASASDDGDLEAIPIDDAAIGGLQSLPTPTSSRDFRWVRGAAMAIGRRVPGAVLVLGLAVVAGLGGGALLVMNRHTPRAGVPAHRPSIAVINSRLAVQTSKVIVVIGEKIVTRSIIARNGTGPLGGLRLAPAPTGVLAVQGTMVVAQGTDESGDGRTGTWAYPTSGPPHSSFLGSSTGFIPDVGPDRVWLTDGPSARRVTLGTGATVAGPYPVVGRLVAAVGAGLLLQRGADVVWWLPGVPGESRPVGTGTALGGLGDYILWRAVDGRVTITDPNIGLATPTALTVPSGQILGPAAMSPDRVRVAVVVGNTLSIGGATPAGYVVRIHLGPVENLAWLDDETLVVRAGDLGVLLVDGASGVTAHQPDLAFPAHGLAVLQPSAN